MNRNSSQWINAISLSVFCAWLSLSTNVADGSISMVCFSQSYTFNRIYCDSCPGHPLAQIHIWDRIKDEPIECPSKLDFQGSTRWDLQRSTDPLEIRCLGDDQGQGTFRIWDEPGKGLIFQFNGGNEEVLTCDDDI